MSASSPSPAVGSGHVESLTAAAALVPQTLVNSGLAATRLRIELNYVCDVPAATDDSAIVRSVITVGHGLRLSVVAGGVATEEQLAFLRDHGCDEMPGWLLGRPMPVADLALWVGRRASQGQAVPLEGLTTLPG